ncbi:MAG: beta strand repeat-containing protein, partial [Pyrinomonadaceae bacterium]
MPAISALRSARKRWRGPIATIALFAMMAGGFALVRASAGDRFASFQWPESLSRIFGSRTTRTLSRPEPMPVAGTENDFFQNTSMNTLGNYTLGLPTNIQDVLLTTSGTALTIAGAPTTRNMGSLDQTNNNAYTIRNSTGTANNSTLNLGGGGTTNSIAGSNGSDLIFLGGTTSSLTIQGPNTDGGTGVLNTVVLADGNFDVANSGATLNLSSILSGNFNLTKSGAGKLTLSGANTFGAGKTFTLQAGTLNINSSTALGAATNTFQINGGTIDNTSGAAITLSNNNAQTWNGDFTFTGGSGTTHDLDFGLGAVSLGTAAGTTRTITTSAGTLITRGIISNGTTANSLTKTGAGTLKLYGASTYSGTTIVNNGTLSLQGSLSSSTIQIDSGATFGTIGLTLQNSQTLKGTATAGQGVINCESPPNCLTMGSTSSLSLAYASGNPTLTVSGTGVFTLQSGNAVTVTNTGSALAAGDYKLISKTGPGAVDGTAPTSVDVVSSATPGVPGSGLAAGTAASLVITGGELFLHVVSTGNTISGALNAGINSSGKTITLLKNGVIVGSNVTGGGATFSFSGVSYNSGDILTVFVDNDASVKGATVTRGSSGDLTGLNIDQNTLTVRHEDAGPITNANLATGNNGDSDLTAVYSVSGSNLTIGSSMTLAVASGKTFTPGGDVTTTNLSNAGTLNAGSGIISISGTFTNTGTFNADTSTVDYNGSVSQVVIALQYYNLTVSNNRSGGSVTFTNGGTVAIGHL